MSALGLSKDDGRDASALAIRAVGEEDFLNRAYSLREVFLVEGDSG